MTSIAIQKLIDIADRIDDPNRRLSLGEWLTSSQLRKIVKELTDDRETLTQVIEICGGEQCHECHEWFPSCELEPEGGDGERMCEPCLREVARDRADEADLHSFLNSRGQR